MFRLSLSRLPINSYYGFNRLPINRVPIKTVKIPSRSVTNNVSQNWKNTIVNKWNHYTDVNTCIFKQDLKPWQKGICAMCGVGAFCIGVKIVHLSCVKGIKYLDSIKSNRTPTTYEDYKSNKSNKSNRFKEGMSTIFIGICSGIVIGVNKIMDIYENRSDKTKDITRLAFVTSLPIMSLGMSIGCLTSFKNNIIKYYRTVQGLDNCCNIIRKTTVFSGNVVFHTILVCSSLIILAMTSNKCNNTMKEMYEKYATDECDE